MRPRRLSRVSRTRLRVDKMNERYRPRVEALEEAIIHARKRIVEKIDPSFVTWMSLGALQRNLGGRLTVQGF